MSAYWIGAIIGALIFGYLWSRLWLWVVKKFVAEDPTRTFIAYGLAWAIAVVLGSFGFSDGGPLAWERSLLIYTPALALWLVVDLLARRARAKRV